MKVIDLLNKTANGEDIPKKIMFNYATGELIKEANRIDYEMTWTDMQCNDHTYWLFDKVGYNDKLNEEIEVLEEDKEIDFDYIEELDLKFGGDCKYRIHAPNGVSYETAGEVGNAVNKLIKNQRNLIKAVNELKKGK